MRVITLFLAVLFLLMSFSFCWAQDTSLKKAYSLYYKGDKEIAMEMMEDYVANNPDPEVFYFLGYAYYEMKKMDKAMDYFSKAYKHKDFYSPMSEEK